MPKYFNTLSNNTPTLSNNFDLHEISIQFFFPGTPCYQNGTFGSVMEKAIEEAKVLLDAGVVSSH